MINFIGMYAFTMAVLTGIACFFNPPKIIDTNSPNFKLRKCLVWIAHVLFLLVALLAWK